MNIHSKKNTFHSFQVLENFEYSLNVADTHASIFLFRGWNIFPIQHKCFSCHKQMATQTMEKHKTETQEEWEEIEKFLFSLLTELQNFMSTNSHFLEDKLKYKAFHFHFIYYIISLDIIIYEKVTSSCVARFMKGGFENLYTPVNNRYWSWAWGNFSSLRLLHSSSPNVEQ